MGKVRGIIKLSRYQTEGNRGEILPLCLKYDVCIAAAVAAFFLWLKNYGNARYVIFIYVSAILFLLSVYMRACVHYCAYRLSARYLRCKCAIPTAKPTAIQMFGCETVLLSFKWTIMLIILLPSAACFKFGLHSFSLSGEREQFMLMLGASFCLMFSGAIFGTIISAHFDCSEYLFFSGRCNSIFSALESSWLIVHENCGDVIMLNIRSALSGMSISVLNKINLSEKLAVNYFDKQRAAEFRVEFYDEKLKKSLIFDKQSW